MEKISLRKINPKLLNGSETFCDQNGNLDLNVSDYWRWAYSDLLSNKTRAVLAEFLVAKALNIDTINNPKMDWESYDLLFEDGLKIEVKASAYLQSWFQKNYSRIEFDIAPKKPWNSEKNEYEEDKKRSADMYVFCLLHHKDKETVNPLDVSQWTFFVLPTTVLNKECHRVRSLTLNRLKKLQPEMTDFHNLKLGILNLKD